MTECETVFRCALVISVLSRLCGVEKLSFGIEEFSTSTVNFLVIFNAPSNQQKLVGCSLYPA